MTADVPCEDWSAALDAVAEQLLWESGVYEPPVDAFYVALELGLTVTQDQQLAAHAQFVRVGAGQVACEQPTIVLGDEDRFERRQFAVAHELGEFAAVRVYDQLGVDPRHSAWASREQVANAMAGRLLLPRRWFQKAGMECEWDLLQLKDMFWTASHELIARRMLDMPPPVVVTLFDQGEVTWRRGNLGSHAGGMLTIEYDTWRECHIHAAPSCSEASTELHRVATRCWPVHEPDWKREVLRTEVVGGQ